MRSIISPKLLIAALCVGCAWPGIAPAESAVQLHVGNSEFEFGFLYSDFYYVETPVVQRCVTVIGEPDFLVAAHLAEVSGVRLELIMDWRERGLSWYEITHRWHRDMNVYYVELFADPGPPYGRAWGHWRKHHERDMRLSDDEIRAFVQLRALSEYGHKPPIEVLRMRRSGLSPVDIAGPRHGKHDGATYRSLSKDRPDRHGKQNKAHKPKYRKH